jgi:hypothetical protein
VVWTYLTERKREPCDQTSMNNLGIALDRLGYRREAAESLYNFVLACREPVEALSRSANIYLKLSDYVKAAEVANEYVRRLPQNSTAHYLRAIALQESGEVEKSLSDYADSIELFGTDKTKISSVVFTRMARAYATLGRFCEASSAILTWVAYDPVHRDNSQSQRLIADYDQKGNCKVTTSQVKQRYPIAKRGAVITVKAEINGVKGNFVLDTGGDLRHHQVDLQRQGEDCGRRCARDHAAHRQWLGQRPVVTGRQGRARWSRSDECSGCRPEDRRAQLGHRDRWAARYELPVAVRGSAQRCIRRGTNARPQMSAAAPATAGL